MFHEVCLAILPPHSLAETLVNAYWGWPWVVAQSPRHDR
jgi:hypothetical protein